MALTYALLAGVIVSLVSLVGLVTFFAGKDLHARLMHMLLALAAGAMLGNAVLHLLPHAITLEQEWLNGAVHVHVDGHVDHDTAVGATSRPPIVTNHDPDAVGTNLQPHDEHEHHHAGLVTAMLLLAGFIGFYAIDILLRNRTDANGEKPEGYLVAVGDGIENFLDGIVLGTAFLISVPVGIAATITVFLHEIPLELGDYAVMRHAGFSMKKAIVTNFLSALLSLVGIVAAYVIGSFVGSFVFFGTAIAVGALFYIAACVLVPHVRQESKDGGGFQYFLVSLFGVALMAAILLFE